MDEYLTDLDYQIFIIEQSDDKPFNRGKLLNVGYNWYDNGCDYFVFHDVDMLPEDVDYSYSDKPPTFKNSLTRTRLRNNIF